MTAIVLICVVCVLITKTPFSCKTAFMIITFDIEIVYSFQSRHLIHVFPFFASSDAHVYIETRGKETFPPRFDQISALVY